MYTFSKTPSYSVFHDRFLWKRPPKGEKHRKIKYCMIATFLVTLYMSGFLKMVLKNCTPELDFTELEGLL